MCGTAFGCTDKKETQEVRIPLGISMLTTIARMITMPLLDFLTSEGPLISMHGEQVQKPKSLTRNEGYFAPRQIKKWVGFDRHTLSKSRIYDHILKNERPREDFSKNIPSTREAHNHDMVETFIYDYNSKVVCEALKESQSLLGRHERISMVRGCFAQPVARENGKRSWRPDWAGICVRMDGPTDGQHPSILPGETKTSNTWRSEDFQIVEGPTAYGKHNRPNWFKPLAQLFTYCFKLGTRYGYLITDKELVVVRIGPGNEVDDKAKNEENGSGTRRSERKKPRKTPPQRKESEEEGPPDIEKTKRNGVLEYASIKWVQGNHNKDTGPGREEGALTVNLALWWLHLLAAKDNGIRQIYPNLEQETLEETGALSKISADPYQLLDEQETAALDQASETASSQHESVGSTTEEDEDDEDEGNRAIYSFHENVSFGDLSNKRKSNKEEIDNDVPNNDEDTSRLARTRSTTKRQRTETPGGDKKKRLRP